MEANIRNLERIFDATIAYQIPLFQRPYVWDEEINWDPLWLDIQSLLDRQVAQGKCHSHFLGAVVFEQLNNPTGSIEARQVIDGQQRLTTLQLFLLAARDICEILGAEKYRERFADLTENKASRIDNETDRFKVWPTNCDREVFARTHSASSPDSVRKAFDCVGRKRTGKNIPDAYLFFSEKLSTWLNGALDDEGCSAISQDDRLEALWQVGRSKLQIVVIDLDGDDESQVIFETLNARGTQLLPADLVKNYLFHKASSTGENVEELYERNWQAFDSDFWREEVRQGRATKPRIDLFLQHYLSLMTLDDVRVSHLFNAFKHFSEEQFRAGSGVVSTPGSQLGALASYGKIFKKFFSPTPGSRLETFTNRLEAVDTATVYPFLLEAYAQLGKSNSNQFDQILVWLESFLVRRMICGLTSKNYNKLFIDLVKTTTLSSTISVDNVVKFLMDGDGDSLRFPNDEEFRKSFLEAPIYDRLAQYKVNAVLVALDRAFEDKKSESLTLDSKLTIEHIMPQTWEDHWPLTSTSTLDQLERQESEDVRNTKIHTFGNLTLVTGSLNPSLSNSGWETKRPEILKFSKLNLTRYFHDKLTWSEAEIDERGKALFEKALEIWPYPAL